MSTDIKNKKNFLIILIILIIIISGVVFYLLKTGTSREDDMSQGEEATNKAQFTLDVDILRTPFFEDLRRYGNFPIKARRSGRKNPFEPYD